MFLFNPDADFILVFDRIGPMLRAVVNSRATAAPNVRRVSAHQSVIDASGEYIGVCLSQFIESVLGTINVS